MVEKVVIPQEHIDMLTENPDGFRLGFDGLHGAGAADRILKGSSPRMQEEDQSGFQKNSVVRERTALGKVWNNSLGAVAHGVQEGVNETIDAFGDLDDWYAERTKELGIKGYLEFGYETEDKGGRGFVFNFTHRPEQGTMFFGGEGEEDNLEFNLVDAPTAMPGQIVSGISQFATIYLSAGRFVKIGGVLGAMTKGAVADALAFDPKDPNVTAMVSDAAGVQPNAFTDLMMTDIDDPNWKNRLRNVAEGAVIGAVVEGAFYGARAVKLARAGRVEEAAEMTKAAAKASKKLENAWARAASDAELQAKMDLPQIAGDLKNAVDEELALKDARGSEPTRGDLPSPVRDPDQPDLPGLSSRDEGAPIRKLTEAEMVKYREARMRADMAEPSDALRGTGITRPGAQASWDEWKGHIGAIREVAKDAWDKIPASQAQTDAHVMMKAAIALREMAQMIVDDPAALLQRFRELPIDPNDMPAEIIARGDVIKLLSNRVGALSDGIDDVLQALSMGKEFPKQQWPMYNSVEHMKVDLAHKQAILEDAGMLYGAQRSSAGRTLRALKLASKNAEGAKKYFEDPHNARETDLLVKAMKMAKETSGGKGVLSVAHKLKAFAGKIIDEINTLRISFLLSGPGTQEVNALSNMLQYFKLPLVQLIGATVSGNPVMMRHAVLTFKGQLLGSWDAIDAAVRVMKKGETELDVLSNKLDTMQDMSLNTSTYRQATTLPMRVLMSMDEFFKQGLYRGRVMADADQLAIGRGLKGTERDTFIKGYLTNSFDEKGMGVRKPALDQAQRGTYTNELMDISIAAQVQKWAQQNPGLRFVVPFVRTPTNILVDAVTHVPGLGTLSKTYKADMAAGGAVAMQARGKQMLGFAMIMGAYQLVVAGNITGSGPKNPDARAIWMKNNRPYSFRVPQEDGTVMWKSYARMEPLSNLLAITADAQEIMDDKYNEFDDDEWTRVMGALLLATAENTVNKTFLQGINDVLKITTSRNEYERQTALRNMAGSFAPNVINQLDSDDYYRVTRGLFDGFKDRMNIKEFDARRDLLGAPIVRAMPKYDPVGAIVNDYVTEDPVFKELDKLARLNQTALTQMQSTVPAPAQPGGRIDLRAVEYKPGQSVYDGLLEHLNTTTIGGKTLREALAQAMDKPGYKGLYEGSAGMDGRGTQIGVVKEILGAYRKKAKATFKPYRDYVIDGKRQKGAVLEEHFNKTNLENKADIFEALRAKDQPNYSRADALFKTGEPDNGG